MRSLSACKFCLRRSRERGFLSLLIDSDERDKRPEHRFVVRKRLTGPTDFHRVGQRGVADSHPVRIEMQNRSLSNAAAEFHPVHGHGDESQAWVFEARRNPGNLIDPAQKVSSKEKPEVIEVLGKNEFVILHVAARVGP